MTCVQASEITAYLQGEGSEEDRAMLRSHYEQCESCARELAASERAFGVLGSLRTIEASPGFTRRAEEALLEANPGLRRRRFARVPHLAAAAAILVVVSAAFVLLRPPDRGTWLGTLVPSGVREEDPEYVFLPPSTRPKTVDAAAWGEAAAYDRMLVAAMRAPRSWGPEVAKALAWLASQQAADGSWKGDTAPETLELTGLAVLALDGTDPGAAWRGVDFLLSRQRDSGVFGGGSPESHAIATLAVLEACSRHGKRPDWHEAERRGIAVIAEQNRDGPWGKGPVAAWQYHVLRLASAIGRKDLIPVLVRGHDAPGSGLWTDPAPDREGWAARAAGLLTRSPIPGTERANFGKNDLRLAYFGTTLLRPLGGDAWATWWSPLRAKLLKAQGLDGSWPEGFEPGKGKIYATALSALILQTPERIPALGD